MSVLQVCPICSWKVITSVHFTWGSLVCSRIFLNTMQKLRLGHLGVGSGQSNFLQAKNTGNSKDPIGTGRANCGWEGPHGSTPSQADIGRCNMTIGQCQQGLLSSCFLFKDQVRLDGRELIERFVNESLLEGFSQFHGLQGDGAGGGGGGGEEFHIPSCPSLPLSTPITSPPFSHMTVAVTEKPSTNISSTWFWPQYISLPGSSQALARPALWCLAPCRD